MHHQHPGQRYPADKPLPQAVARHATSAIKQTEKRRHARKGRPWGRQVTQREVAQALALYAVGTEGVQEASATES